MGFFETCGCSTICLVGSFETCGSSTIRDDVVCYRNELHLSMPTVFGIETNVPYHIYLYTFIYYILHITYFIEYVKPIKMFRTLNSDLIYVHWQ